MTLSDWKQFEITQVIYSELKARREELKEILSIAAGKEPLEDRYKAGYIQAINDFLDVQLDEESHGN